MLLFTATILSAIYNLIIVSMSKTLLKMNSKNNNQQKTASIIISARNEGSKLTKLINLLMNQTYPEELYEVIMNYRSHHFTRLFTLQEAQQQCTSINYRLCH